MLVSGTDEGGRRLAARTLGVVGHFGDLSSRDDSGGFHQENVDRPICAYIRQNQGAVVRVHTCLHLTWTRLQPLLALLGRAYRKPYDGSQKKIPPGSSNPFHNAVVHRVPASQPHPGQLIYITMGVTLVETC